MPHTDWKVADATPPVITVEAVAEGRWLAHVDGADLALERVAEQERVRDVDFARFLGYERPRKIRDLIRRMITAGKLSGDAVCTTVGRIPEGGRPAKEFWLTRTQALLVATQSDTPRAWAMTETIVAVFEAVCTGARGLGPEIVTALRAELARVAATYDARIRELEAQRAAAPVYLTPRERGAQLRALLGQYAAKMHRLHPSVSLRGWRKRAEDRVRDIVAYPRGLAHTLDAMPFDLWERAMLHATALNAAVSALLPRGTQLDLPPTRPN